MKYVNDSLDKTQIYKTLVVKQNGCKIFCYYSKR